MTVNFPGAGTPIPELGSRRVENTTTNNAPQTLPEPPAAAEVEIDLEATEQRRFERVERATTEFFNEFFAVSDTTFSIYKDASGQFITRFTSLRDGSVTFIPEPDLLQFLSNRGGGSTIVEIDA